MAYQDKLTTDFNVAPFYDDFDEDKQYYRVLFRPATAVQARELTQLQTIMQAQISRFGDSIYKSGTIIEGCGFRKYNLKQIKFKDKTSTSLDFSEIVIDNTDVANDHSHHVHSHLLVSNTTGLRAAVFQAFIGSEDAVKTGTPDTNRAYVQYVNSGNNNGTQVNQFSTVSEQIDVYSSAQDKTGPLVTTNRLGVLYTLSSNSSVNALGVGMGLHVQQGIIYQKGFFLKAKAANFVVKEHNDDATAYAVGWSTKEYIVKPSEDESLYDNSLGSSNYSAPGAYRLKLVPQLVAYDTANTSVKVPQGFLPIMQWDAVDGKTKTVDANPLYSLIGDALAKRTLEESGNYVVQPFSLEVEAHESNTQLMYYNVNGGVAYIDGYRVPSNGPYLNTRVPVQRGIVTTSANNGAVSLNYGNYIRIADVSGTLDIANLPEVTFYSANQYSLSKQMGNATNPLSGSYAIANANVRAIVYDSGTKGTPSATYLLYISNLRINPNILPGSSFTKNAYSVYVNGTYGPFFGDLVQNTGSRAEILETGNRALLFNTGFPGVKRLTNDVGVNATQYLYRITQTQNLTKVNGIATATISLGASEDVYNYSGTITDVPSRPINITFNTAVVGNNALEDKALVSVSGNVVLSSVAVNATSTGSIISVPNTASFAPGYVVQFSANITGTNVLGGPLNPSIYYVNTVINSTQFTISNSYLGSRFEIVGNGSNTSMNVFVSSSQTSTLTKVGTSAPWSSRFVIGQGLRINGTFNTSAGTPGTANTVGPYVTITAINSANSITVTPNVGAYGVTAVTPYPFFKRGTHINMEGDGNTIIVSNDRKSANVNLAGLPELDGDYNSYSIAVQIPINRSGATPIQKVVNKNRLIKIDMVAAGVNNGNINGPWCLGLPDVYKINAVHVGSSYSFDNPDKKNYFTLDTGQTKTHYGLSFLKLKPNFSGVITSSSYLIVNCNHFSANITTAKAGFFSVESYPADDTRPNANDYIATAEIPLYISEADEQYDLRNYIDVRPILANTANSVTSLTAATINPANNNSRYFTGSGTPIAIEPNENIIYNIESYLPRNDSLIVTATGLVTIKQGQPSFTPRVPTLNNTGLKIADVYVPPYPSLTFKEAE